MDLATLIVIIFTWQIFGGIFALIIAVNSYADGFELVNPYWVYQYNKSVNWFGATVLALGYTALCPIGALGYWFYKLCTVGRK